LSAHSHTSTEPRESEGDGSDGEGGRPVHDLHLELAVVPLTAFVVAALAAARTRAVVALALIDIERRASVIASMASSSRA